MAADWKKMLEIHRMVQQHCKVQRIDDQDYAVYDQGWSDQRIANQLDASLHAVQLVRKDTMGKIRGKGRPKGSAPWTTKVKETIDKLNDDYELMLNEINIINEELRKLRNEIQQLKNDRPANGQWSRDNHPQ